MSLPHAGGPEMGPSLPSIEDIPEPLFAQTDSSVANVYPTEVDGSGVDVASATNMEAYLAERLVQPSKFSNSFVSTPSGVRLPWIERQPTGNTKLVPRISRVPKDAIDAYVVSRRVSVAVVAGSAVLAGLLTNGGTIVQDGRVVAHKIERAIHPLPSHEVTTTTTSQKPGELITSTYGAQIATTDVAGRPNYDLPTITNFMAQLNNAEQSGGVVKSITIFGETSNDWGARGDAALGTTNPGNQALGAKIAAAAANKVQPVVEVHGKTVPVAVASQETVLSADQKADLETAAHTAGYQSVESAVKAADSGKLKAGPLFNKVKQYLLSKRGARIEAVVTQPGEPETLVTQTKTKVSAVDNAPKPGRWHLFPFLPLPPIRRRFRYEEEVPEHRWKLIPAKRLYRLERVREPQNIAWVQLRPEAMNSDNTLVPRPWAYSRKFEDLLRDDRIKGTLVGKYKTSDDERRELAISFVDHEPTEDTKERFSSLLRSFASIQDGALGKRVSGIFVYPSESAGTRHNDPRRIAIGVDTQEDKGVLGVFTPSLELAELHMPTTSVTAAELVKLFENFDDSPAHTLAHEVAGHGVDITDRKVTFRPVRAAGHPNAYKIAHSNWAEHMDKLDAKLPALHQRVVSRILRRQRPIQFDIVYQVLDRAGRTITRSDRVAANDHRLAIAQTATIVGRKPTNYAASSAGEHLAELAAAVVTGDDIPFAEAKVAIADQQTDSGELAAIGRGYRPDQQTQDFYTKLVGAQPGSYPAAFDNAPQVAISYGHPTENLGLLLDTIATRSSHTLDPQQMLSIMSRVVRVRSHHS